MSGVRRVGQLGAMRTGVRETDRALEDVRTRVNHLLGGAFSDAIALEVVLVEGLNKIGHGIGTPVAHFIHAALPVTGVSIANVQIENPNPGRQIWVRMTGTPSLKVLLFLLPTVG